MKKFLSLSLISVAALATAGLGVIPALAATSYTAAQVAQHNTASNCWLIINNQVYNVTTFIPNHPGGTAIVPYCGTDATSVYTQIHGSSPTAAADLAALLIGNLATSTVLTTPTNVVGTPSQTSVSLTWTASTGGTAPITYSVIRNGASVATTTLTTFSDIGLATSTAYSYIIKATDSASPTPATVSSAAISVTTTATGGTGPGKGEDANENESSDDGINTNPPPVHHKHTTGHHSLSTGTHLQHLDN